VGRPRKLGGDYYGVDVNVAARVAAAAGPGEVLVSEITCEHLDATGVRLRQRRRFRAKGAPKELKVFAAEPAVAD
jgi:class 3 adenylate cyclase